MRPIAFPTIPILARFSHYSSIFSVVFWNNEKWSQKQHKQPCRQRLISITDGDHRVTMEPKRTRWKHSRFHNPFARGTERTNRLPRGGANSTANSWLAEQRSTTGIQSTTAVSFRNTTVRRLQFNLWKMSARKNIGAWRRKNKIFFMSAFIWISLLIGLVCVVLLCSCLYDSM